MTTIRVEMTIDRASVAGEPGTIVFAGPMPSVPDVGETVTIKDVDHHVSSRRWDVCPILQSVKCFISVSRR